MTLQQRIAALSAAQAAHLGRTSSDPPIPRPRPQVPIKRPIVIRQKTVNNPPEQLNGTVANQSIGNQPAKAPRQPVTTPTPTVPFRENSNPTLSRKIPPPLPRRQPSVPPPLPERQDSSESSRRGSGDSAQSRNGDHTDPDGGPVSNVRSKSIDRIKAPAWGEEQLPPLPPRGAASKPRSYSTERPKYVNRAPSAHETILPAVTLASLSSSVDGSYSSPQLPARRPSNSAIQAADIVTISSRDILAKKAPPMPSKETINKFRQSAQIVNSPQTQTLLQSVPNATTPSTNTLKAIPSTQQAHSLISTGRSLISNPPPQTSSQSIPNTATQATITPKPIPLTQQVHSLVSAGRSLLSNAPPIPISSRPDLTILQAARPKSTTSIPIYELPAQSDICLVCRDFSQPDQHAALFPRSQVTSLQVLGQQLTNPFPSPTDKARAIFAWLHYNIQYDVVSFFNNNVRGSTPQSTLQSGLAVCEGYAALFANLATHAGLECVVINGHGKGFGHQQLAPGSPLPVFDSNHAWNAVKIDNGEWKLIDPCWGAGHVQGKGMPYIAKFNETMFSMSNEEFGIKHFPSNKEHFFLPHGQRMTWEDYITINPANWPGQAEGPTVFTNAREDYGIGERTVLPRQRKINSSQPGTIRFQFGLLCPHWSLEHHTKQGPPPVFIIVTQATDRRAQESYPLEHVPGRNADGGVGGDIWFVDISANDLGAPGQTVTLFAVTSFGNRNDCRGLTVREFKEGKGRVAMGFRGVAAWELV